MTEPAFKIEVTEGRVPSAWRIILFGTPAIGKSTFATLAPNPLFLDLENGLRYIDCRKTQHLQDFEQFMVGMRFAYASDCKTVVIDSITKLEDYLTAEVCQKQHVQVLGDIPWGRGPDFLVNEWKQVIDMTAKLMARGKNVLMIGHDQIIEHQDPTSENYHRYAVRLNKKSLPVLTQEVDAIFFAHWEKYVKAKADGKGRMAIGTGKRMIRAVEDPSALAKNRFNLEELLDMEPSIFDRLV